MNGRGVKIDAAFSSVPGITKMVMSYTDLYDLVNRVMAVQVTEAMERGTIEGGLRRSMEADYVAEVMASVAVEGFVDTNVEVRTPLRSYHKFYRWTKKDNEILIVASFDRWHTTAMRHHIQEKDFLCDKGFQYNGDCWQIAVMGNTTSLQTRRGIKIDAPKI